jgi:hypothetical protein
MQAALIDKILKGAHGHVRQAGENSELEAEAP